ncbi:LOW QUALITY PROTEIN: uncharacterized protein LOC116106953 [Pistacia vera]|uniref:LOW QUALITY PROTEIN: uncharacterized protein LOC116106953 n=1 Tax=Pistacia vera TaxID=55513 RepID=UPI001262EAAD|nr:LOW QUALITY PROTEIN: uncharacterized protein LOC116106953 [Pistacia vera]
MASSSSVISPEDVLESLMNDGTFDSLRLKIINQLKANEELKSTTIKMAEQSKVLNTPGAEKQTKRELFDALRQELEAPVLEKASKSVWELILDNNGLGKEINETVEKVFCRLSGSEPPLFPPSVESQPDKVTENEKRNVKGKGKGKAKEHEDEKEGSNSKLKKRSFIEMNDGKRELFDALRQELEAPVLEKASKSVWELILDNNGLGKEINETVEKVFCRLSGSEPPLFPPSVESQPDKGTENEKRKGKGKGKGKAKEHEDEKEGSNSKLKKRSFIEMNDEGGVDEVVKDLTSPGV